MSKCKIPRNRQVSGVFLLYRKYRVTLKREICVSYRAKSPIGQNAQLAEKKFMLRIPLARESVRQAHTLFRAALIAYPYPKLHNAEQQRLCYT